MFSFSNAGSLAAVKNTSLIVDAISVGVTIVALSIFVACFSGLTVHPLLFSSCWIVMAFAFAGVALLHAERKGVAREVSRACACVVGAMGFVSVMAIFSSDLSLQIERWFPHQSHPLLSSLFLPLAGSLYFLSARKTAQLAHWLAVPVLGGGLLGLVELGYGYIGTPPAEIQAGYANLLSPVFFSLLGFGALLRRPSDGFGRMVVSNSAGGWVFRRMLLLAVAMPLLLGWLHVVGEHYNLIDENYLISFIVVVMVGVLVFSLWLISHQLNITARERLRAEDTMRDSMEQYRLLFENSVSGVATHEMHFDASGEGADYTFLSVNPSFESQTGLKSADIIGRRVTDILPGIEKSIFIQAYAEVVRAGKPMVLEHFAEPLGRHYQVTAYSLGHNKFATVFHDVTERKKMMMTLREREAFLQQLLDTMPTPVFYKDNQGRYMGANKAFEEFFGVTKEQYIGKNVYDLSPRELAEVYAVKDQELFDKKGVQIYSFFGENANKERRDLMFYKASLTNGAQDITGLIGVMLDVTERKRAEDALRENEAFLSLLLNTVTMPVFSKDREGRYIKVNKAFETLLWRKNDEIIGKTVFDLFLDGEQAARSHEADLNLLFDPSAGPTAYFSEITDALGVKHEVIIQKAAFLDDFGQVKGIIGSILDITDIKHTEDELRELISHSGRAVSGNRSAAHASRRKASGGPAKVME